MTNQELEDLRRQKWRLNGNPVRTLEDAREFIESVGFALMYPLKPAVLLPTLVGAWAGSDEKLPTWQHAFADPRARDATELMVRLLRERDAYEANLLGENSTFLVAASIFPYFYALVGEPNFKQAPKAGPRSNIPSWLAMLYAAINRRRGLYPVQLQQELGGSVSRAAWRSPGTICGAGCGLHA